MLQYNVRTWHLIIIFSYQLESVFPHIQQAIRFTCHHDTKNSLYTIIFLGRSRLLCTKLYQNLAYLRTRNQKITAAARVNLQEQWFTLRNIKRSNEMAGIQHEPTSFVLLEQTLLCETANNETKCMRELESGRERDLGRFAMNERRKKSMKRKYNVTNSNHMRPHKIHVSCFSTFHIVIKNHKRTEWSFVT